MAKKKSGGRFHEYVKDIKQMIYNGEESNLFGRSGLEWGKLILFYFVFYACLAVFFAAMIATFFATIDQDRPKLKGKSSLLKGSPSVGFRPNPDYQTTLIAFRTQDHSSFDMYVNNMESYLMMYDKSNIGQGEGENLKSCSHGNGATEDQACVYNLAPLQASPCSKAKFFGYRDGQPCVMLKLNKVFGWSPEPLSAAEGQRELGKRWDPDYIGVKCRGETAADQENLGHVAYYPDNGWPAFYYPYFNQKGYLAPLVMVEFRNITQGVVVFVECKAFAKNIQHDSEKREGVAHFEILVDS